MADASKSWTFLTNHGHVLLSLADLPDQRVSEIARRVGITERAVLSILKDLEDEGYITVRREGRKNAYEINPDLPLRHPRFSSHQIGELLRALGPGGAVGGT